MAIAGKNVKKFERWVLIGIVIILIATFSISGVTSQGCGGGPTAAGADDVGGTFQPAPGKTRSVTNDDIREVHSRYHLIHNLWGPSLRFAGEMRQQRGGRELIGTWMHIVLTAAAEEAGYRVGDEELAAAIRRLVPQWTNQGGRDMPPPPFSAELYDRVIVWMSQRSGQAISKAEFEKTIKEMLLKDKLIGDLVALERVPKDRNADFAAWKQARERVDLAFGAVPGASFLEGVKAIEETRTAISALDEPLRKLLDAAKIVRRLTGILDEWRKRNGDAWPADAADLLKREPGPSKIGTKMIDDPWGRPYAYEKTAEGGRIVSHGADGKPATPDDVTPTTTAVVDTLGTLRRAGDAIVTWNGAAKDWPASIEDVTKAPPAEAGKPAIAPPLSQTPKDAWGRELAWDKATHTLRSAGPDGVPANGDDVTAEVSEGRATVPFPESLAALGATAGKDAWGRPLVVDATLAASVTFSVRSAGANGTPHDDDDVLGGNANDLETYLNLVKSAHRVPARYEFEALYVIPSLVSDEIFAQAWQKFPKQQPDEKTAWDLFFKGLGFTYVVSDGTAKDAPPIDAKDPEKGYGAALRKHLVEKGALGKDAIGWPVPAPEAFGDRKDLKAPPAPGLEAEPIYKLYIEKGWRYVALRDQFFANLLDLFLKTARDAAASKPATPPVEPKTFASQLAELRDLQPSVDDAAKGARFLQLFATKPGEPLDHRQIEANPEIGSDTIAGTYLAPMKEGAYDVVPRALRTGEVQLALHLVKATPDHEPSIAEARDAIWPGYLESRAVGRAAEELERVRLELAKKFDERPAPGAPAATPLDAAAKQKLFEEALQAAAAARKFELFLGRTGVFVGATARGREEPKSPPLATPAEKDAIRRRAYVRSAGYPTVTTSAKHSTAVGTLGRQVLRDDRRSLGETPTHAAYVVMVAAQSDPAPEEFQGDAYLEWVAKSSYSTREDDTALADVAGTVPEALHRLYDDWETIKHDYAIETKVDLLVPKEARGGP